MDMTWSSVSSPPMGTPLWIEMITGNGHSASFGKKDIELLHRKGIHIGNIKTRSFVMSYIRVRMHLSKVQYPSGLKPFSTAILCVLCSFLLNENDRLRRAVLHACTAFDAYFNINKALGFPLADCARWT
jgi:hypothetical protein